jgi:hypothetical protein
MHEAERVMLEDSPYIILVHNNDIQVTRTDTWTGYRPSPDPKGYPFLTSWLQLLLLEPGQRATTNYSGAPAVIIGLFAGIVVIWLVARWRRRREESGPLEIEPAAGGATP